MTRVKMKSRSKVWKGKYLIGLFLGFLIPRPSSHNRHTYPFIYHNQPETPNKRDLLLIGIMTNSHFIHERGCAIKKTWGKHIRDIVFYLEETPLARQPDCDIGTVVHLKDGFQPQKKVFMMFQHMESHYGDRYKWFLGVDDDAYVNFDNLRTFLSSVRSLGNNGSHVFHHRGQVIRAMFSCGKS